MGSDYSAAWLARAAALEREAETFRAMAQTDDEAGRLDMADRCRRSAADRDTEARVLRECVQEVQP